MMSATIVLGTACGPIARADDTIALSTSTTLVNPIAPAAPTLCAASNPFAGVQNLNEVVSPCVLAPHAAYIETVYLQNASAVGGTALAAYPLVRAGLGIVPRVQFEFNLPSEIAQSRPGGGGAFPITHPGFGLTYLLAQTSNSATAIVSQVLPADSRFAATHAQARYQLGLSSDVAITKKWTLGGAATATTSTRAGSNMISPELDLSSSYAMNGRTQFVTGIGARTVTRNAVAQSFSDVSVNQLLNRKLLFTVGLGTTFNAVNNAKPHYLATGFTYRP